MSPLKIKVKDNFKYDPRKDGVTQSILSGFLKCREFSRLSLEGWTPLKTGAALQFGEIAHNVLDVVYSEVRDGKRKKSPQQEEVVGYIAEQQKLWEKSVRGMRAGKEESEQLEVNAALLEAVLPHYFKFWEKEDFGGVKWVALEKEFDLFLYGVRMRGKIDGLFRDKAGALQLLETKTKGRIEEGNLFDLLAFDFQTNYYDVAAEQVFKEAPKGARYNVIRRPGQKLKQGERLGDYVKRVEKEIIDDPKHYFLRFRIDKPKKEMDLFKKELQIKVKDFVDWCDGKIPTYRNETACMDRFGACRFLKICSSGNYDGFYKREQMHQELAPEGGKK